MSDGWSTFVNSTPFGGAFDSGENNKKAAAGALGDEKNAYSQVDVPNFSPVQQHVAQQQTAAPTMAGPSAYNNISTNPAYTKAQTNQMTALSNLAANGGRSAASDANLARIQQQSNANAQGQRGAIMQQAAARGQSGSGNSLLAALSAQQGAISDQNAQDLGVAGQEANTAIQAGQGAAGIGAGLRNQDFGEQAAIAGANDATSRFNAGEGTRASEFNAGQGNGLNQFNAGQGNQVESLNNYTMPQARFSDQLGRANGIAGADQNAVGWNTKEQGIAAKKQGGLWNGAKDIGKEAYEAFAHGGEVPSGLGGLSKSGIAHPSSKEAMLSAIQNLRKKSMGAPV